MMSSGDNDKHADASISANGVLVSKSGDPCLVALESLNSTVNDKFGGYRGLVEAAKVRLSLVDEESEDSRVELPKAPPDIVDVLKVIALNGVLPYAWTAIRIGLCLKLVEVCLESYGQRGWSPKEGTFAESSRHLLQLLNKFSNDAPFTIQRLTEVLLDGMSQYTVTHKLLKALEKQLSVETTLDQVDDGTGELTLVEHHDHWLREDNRTSGEEEEKEEEGKSGVEKVGENLENEGEQENGREENEVGGGLKRRGGHDLTAALSSKRIRGDEIEQPQAFTSSFDTDIGK